MTLGELDKALDYPGFEVTHAALGNESFNRIRQFEVNGLYCRIIWWENACYLYTGDLIVLFSEVKQRNTWPNDAKMNLQFYIDAEICAILKIE